MSCKNNRNSKDRIEGIFYIFLVTLRIFTMFPQKKYYALRGKLEMIFGMVVFPVIAGILARYGGDEFCIAGEMLREETEQLIKNLYENLEKANKQAACPYDIGMSVGCAQFTKEVRTIRIVQTRICIYEKNKNVLICKFRIDEKRNSVLNLQFY